MDFQLKARSGRPPAAAGDMTIYQASRMKELLLSAKPTSASRPKDLVLDLSKVTDFDTCGLQVLLMLRRAALEGGSRLVLQAPSAVVREALELCGLQDLCRAHKAA